MKQSWTACAVVVALAAAASAQQPASEGVVMRTLDEPIDIVIIDSPIPEALDRIMTKAGVDLLLTDEARDLLPHGEQTRLALRARNVPLRDALTAMLEPVAQRWELRDGRIAVVPTEPLQRIGRRPTFAEVRLLGALAAMRIAPDRPFIDQLRQSAELPDAEIWWQVPQEQRARAQTAAEQAMRRGGQSGLELLGRMTEPMGWTWYAWGHDIIILPAEEQTRRQLQRRVTVSYANEPLVNVLMDLSERADVELRMEPGVLQHLPDEQLSELSLMLSDATIEQALEAISGITGLAFVPQRQAIRVEASAALREEGGSRRRERSPFIVMMTVPSGEEGLEYQVLFRPDDLPPALVDSIQARKERMIEAINAQYAPID